MTARHRVPHKGSRLLRNEDPARSRDPRVRAVVAQLQAVQLPAPSSHFRAELRAQLVAVAPRLVADGVAEQRQAVRNGGTRTAKELESRRPRIRLGRPLAVLTTFVAVCALVLGGAVWLSQKSLPGDTLYGLKRASENVQLSLDFNDTDRATDYLHFSQARVQEAQDLLHRASASSAGIQADGVSTETANELTSTLNSADRQLTDGWILLAKSANASKSSTPLATMKGWAPGQISRLATLSAAMPTKALQQRAQASKLGAQGALQKARELSATLAKPTSAPVSPTSRTSQQVGTNGKTGTPATPARASSTTTAKRPTTKRAATKAATTTHAASQGRPSKSVASKSPKALLPSLIRPHVPSHKPSVRSCGISLPVGIQIGHCKTHS